MNQTNTQSLSVFLSYLFFSLPGSIHELNKINTCNKSDFSNQIINYNKRQTRGDRERLLSFLIYSVIPLSQFSLSCDSWRLRSFVWLQCFCPPCVFNPPPHPTPNLQGCSSSDFTCITCNTKTLCSSTCQLMLVMVSSVASDISELKKKK